jgi:CubicO group peptidase (beta-lactamase class C family)
LTAVAGRPALDRPALTRLLSDCAQRHGVPGAQLAVYQAGELVCAETGEVTYGRGEAVGTGTAFPIGSVTKAVTATAVMALVADGDLELDEPASRHVGGLTGVAATATVRQLLSHTGGLPCSPAPEQVADLSAARYLAYACRPDRMVLPPGAAFSYSNVGYVLLGEVIAAVTGMSWADAVAAIVLNPLGVRTGLISAPGTAGSGRPVASGHSVHPGTGRVRPVRQSLVPAEAAAGALALSAADLVALGRLHVGAGVPAVLPAAHAARMRALVPDAVPFGLARGWGLGLAVYGTPPRVWAGHDGNADGTTCCLRIDAAGGRIVALTAGVGPGAGAGLWSDLAAELGRRGIPLEDTLPRPAAAAECVGEYRNGDLAYLVTAGGPLGLQLSVDGEPAENLVVGVDLSFYIEDRTSGRWTVGGRFVRDPDDDSINGIQIGGRLGRRCVEALL